MYFSCTATITPLLTSLFPDLTKKWKLVFIGSFFNKCIFLRPATLVSHNKNKKTFPPFFHLFVLTYK